MTLWAPMIYQTDDLTIKEIKELLPPANLLRDFPITAKAAKCVYEARREIHRILHGADDRLLVIMGPCSIHDVKAAKEYAGRLREAKERCAADLLIMMRVYFEKPRTTAPPPHHFHVVHPAYATCLTWASLRCEMEAGRR